MINDNRAKRLRKIVNLFFEDLAVLFVIAPIGIIFCYFIIAQEKWSKWLPLVIIILLIWYVAVGITKRFKLYLLCRKDIKESRILKKEIVIEEFKFDHDYHATHRTSTHDFLEDLIVDVLLGWTEHAFKTSGGENRYILTDTEKNTYHLMNFYKTKMRKKDIKGKLLCSELKGKVMEIEYLEKSKLILSIKMDKATKNSRLIGGFWEIFGGYMI